METLLFQCREALGRPPRGDDSPSHEHLHFPTPLWARIVRDPLRMTSGDAAILRERGEIVWAAIVTANTSLLSPGSGDRPASVVYSLAPHYDAHILELLGLAQVLSTLADDDRGREDLRELGKAVASKRRRASRLMLPEDITDGREVFFTDVLIHRENLPGGYLSDSWIPILADPTGETNALAVLPKMFWPDELIDLWTMDPPDEDPEKAASR